MELLGSGVPVEDPAATSSFSFNSGRKGGPLLRPSPSEEPGSGAPVDPAAPSFNSGRKGGGSRPGYAGFSAFQMSETKTHDSIRRLSAASYQQETLGGGEGGPHGERLHLREEASWVRTQRGGGRTGAESSSRGIR